MAPPAGAAPNDAWAAMVAFFAGGAVSEAASFGSVDEMADGSDLVVLARFTGVGEPRNATAPDLGENDTVPPITTFTLTVLDGSPDLTPGDDFAVDAFGVSVAAGSLAPTTDHALLFLHRRTDTGTLRLVSSTGLIVNRAGTARLALPTDQVPASRAAIFGDGRPFDELTASMEAARR